MNKDRLTYLKFFWVILVCMVLTVTCDKKEEYSLEELEYLALNPPPEIRKSVLQGDFEFTVDYLPAEILLLSEYKYLQKLKDKNASKKTIERQEEFIKQYRKSFESAIQFRLVISPVEDADLVYARMERGFDSYSKWLQNLLFGIREDILLVTPGGDEVPLIDYLMDRNYGTSKSRSFLLTFPKTWNGIHLKEQDFLKFRINEFGLGTGRVTLRFELPLPEIIYLPSTINK